MIQNRSVPVASVIPELAYDDVAEASDWLCNAFGFTPRLGGHRWTFSESIADVDPASWGGALVKP